MFEPYEIAHGIDDLRFYVGNQEGADWYDPLKPYTWLEYQWVRDNVDYQDKIVLDCGAHHGNYSVVFKGAFVYCIEPVAENVTILERNLKLNGMDWAVCTDYIGESNLPEIAPPNVSIVKMDIEGAEFQALPEAIDRMPAVKDWIVEIHPHKGNPHRIVDAFHKRGFEVLKVYRDTLEVKQYKPHVWRSHATIIARKGNHAKS